MVCSPGCICGKHYRTVRKKCLPDCTCRRHKAFHPERLRKMAEGRHAAATGWYISNDGHKYLTGMQWHPLAIGKGVVAEHRYVLYEKIGPGTHPCYWCGQPRDWGGRDGIHVDHMDNDPLNNEPWNLEPSCWLQLGRATKIVSPGRNRMTAMPCVCGCLKSNHGYWMPRAYRGFRSHPCRVHKCPKYQESK